jgi:hypothetical protein
MRGHWVSRQSDDRSGVLFSYVDLEERVPGDHSLRVIREIANSALTALDRDFAALYPPRLGRPSIPRSGSFGGCCCKHFMESDPSAS